MENDRRGVSLIFTVFIVLILVVTSAALFAAVFGLTSSCRSQLNYLKAYYLAEAGIEYSKSHLLSDPGWSTPGETVSAGSGRFTVRRGAGKDHLTSDGFSGRAHVIIRLDVIDHSPYIQREE
ncbi:MAG TPA: hypothetical protein VMD02_01335 [Candidatus Omnitrophota bacterium]|nr:hypothetical protein [Candidatus Omnitrophota bacterium]